MLISKKLKNKRDSFQRNTTNSINQMMQLPLTFCLILSRENCLPLLKEKLRTMIALLLSGSSLSSLLLRPRLTVGMSYEIKLNTRRLKNMRSTLNAACQYDHGLIRVMIKNTLKASDLPPAFSLMLSQLLLRIDEALTSSIHLTYDERQKYMEERDLDFSFVCDTIAAAYDVLIANDEWVPAKLPSDKASVPASNYTYLAKHLRKHIQNKLNSPSQGMGTRRSSRILSAIDAAKKVTMQVIVPRRIKQHSGKIPRGEDGNTLHLMMESLLRRKSKELASIWFWDAVRTGKINVAPLSTTDQNGDYLTKGMVQEPFEANRKSNQGW